jgi:3-phosphoshikimate 1-carboxyvinyltransferase
MGARFYGRDPDHLPLTVQGGPLRALEWEMPVSSAQIKSSLLFAGLVGGVPVAVREPAGRSRDHTERLFRSFGYRVDDSPDGWIRFQPTGNLEPFDLDVPGDTSSAALLVGLALLADEGSLRVADVGLNPTRTGFLRVLERMGAKIRTMPAGERCGEPVGDLLVEPSELRATTVSAGEIPGLIDEIPLLAVVASRAAGVTAFHDVGELRVKESDRLGLLAANLRAIGAKASVEGDALVVEGGSAPPIGLVHTDADHRIAMAFAVLGKVAGAEVEVDNLACAEVSFPDFAQTLHAAMAHPGTG